MTYTLQASARQTHQSESGGLGGSAAAVAQRRTRSGGRADGEEEVGVVDEDGDAREGEKGDCPEHGLAFCPRAAAR